MKKIANALLIAALTIFSSIAVFAETVDKDSWGPSSTGAIVYGQWDIADDGTVTSTLSPGWNQIYNGNHDATDFTVKADIKWLETGSAEFPKFGLITTFQDVNNMTAAFLDKQFNVLAIFAKVQGQDDQWINVDLPEDFDWSVAHELKVVKSGEQYEYFVDGEKLTTQEFAISNGEIGLITEDSKAEFANVSVEYPLPDTATNSYNTLLFGALLVAAGGAFFFLNRRKVNA
ncbi:LPXTG cell wall anchor domain-containing protein [Salirhabdus salicampi]|uniref:LPXTG cell wall anchor domain-containing protein n=1 Tax=Salirhabdus salicampi TaxID=476102 RepID=UPI0020C5794D|nr:LPXTG cell wall anchor domain-containing protein [Salirhabdus salicampi]MCP8617557.1 LPXTG cell wall anchor domain-containing protein [Salirhabdus salicampi]